MAAEAAPYSIRLYDPADEPAVLELLERTPAGGPTGTRSPDFFRWKHRHSPFGPSPIWMAEAEGRIVGLRAFQRWRFVLERRPVEAVRPVDTGIRNIRDSGSSRG